MRYDERDTLFSKMHTMMKKKSAEANKRPIMMGKNVELPDHKFAVQNLSSEYRRISSGLDNEAFAMKVSDKIRSIPKDTMSELLKEFVKLSGLDVVGITKVEKEDLYTHRGFSKKEHNFADEIEHRFEYAIVFAAPIELDYINRSPSNETFMGAMLAYAKSSEVAARLVMYIKDLGYDAITDGSISYETPISFLGEKAGLGQMGRCNAVVNPKYGNRTKFAAVHTNLPLTVDKPIDFGLHDFCELCRRCETNCLGKAIAHDASLTDDGSKYWEHDSEACMKVWKQTGASCGVCMSSCPFSQGVDLDKVESMKDNKDVMIDIIRTHQKTYGKRNSIDTPLDFMPKDGM